MSTTNLFVELVVVGVGAAAWLCLLVLAGFGYAWIPLDRLFSPSAILPQIALVYLLGIITDRLADALFAPAWTKGNRARIYGQDSDAYAADKALVLSELEFAKFYQYNKSRQRICRGWTFNAIVILLSLHALLWFRFGPNETTFRIALLGSLFLSLLAYGSWFSGKRLNSIQYQKMKEQASILRARKNS